MKLKIEIATDNAAFGDDGDAYQAGMEAGRILRALAEKLENEGLGQWSEGVLRDANGNRVGEWSHYE